MRLFIAEKPSLGRSIAEALPEPHIKAENSIICGKDDIVTWSAGHILSLYEPQDYNLEHRIWKLADIPHIPQQWKYKEREEARSLLATIQRYLNKADVVVNAGDADREGQLLIDEILDYYAYKGKTYRLLITDNNPEAIKKAIGKMKPNEEYKGLSQAGQARAMSDWLLGLNLTRLYTLLAKNNNNYGGTVLSIGRVQTPVLGLIVRRDEEIENFVSKLFYVIQATFMTDDGFFNAIWQPEETQIALDEKGRLLDKSVAEKMAQKFRAIPRGLVTQADKKLIKKAAPLPYSLPALQIDASKKYNLSPAKTLEIVQKLYEAGMVTYPRSDCSYLPETQYEEIPQVLSGIISALPDLAASAKAADTSKKHSAFNSDKVAEHFAIIPTGKSGKLQGEYETIYRLIALRYIALLYPEHEYYETKIIVTLAEEKFTATGKEIIQQGWMQLYKEENASEEITEDETDNNKNATLPKLTKGMDVGNKEIKILEKKTKPPEHYTEATLLAAMGNIHKFVQNEEIKKILKENEGIGTAATQADIINKIYIRNYANKKGKQIISTEKGRKLIHLLPDILTQPDLTALWEKEMSYISQGQKSLETFLKGVQEQLIQLIASAQQTKERIQFKVEGSVHGKNDKTQLCIKCNAPLRFINSQKGKFWICTNNDQCKATYSDEKGKPMKPSICPKCKKNPLRKMKGKNGDFWVCNCGYTASDKRGKPQAARPCKKCGSVQKKYTAKTSGKIYWKCVDCQEISYENKY